MVLIEIQNSSGGFTSSSLAQDGNVYQAEPIPIRIPLQRSSRSDTRSLLPQRKLSVCQRSESSFRGLAMTCAASSLQSLWRGYWQRRRRNARFTAPQDPSVFDQMSAVAIDKSSLTNERALRTREYDAATMIQATCRRFLSAMTRSELRRCTREQRDDSSRLCAGTLFSRRRDDDQSGVSWRDKLMALGRGEAGSPESKSMAEDELICNKADAITTSSSKRELCVEGSSSSYNDENATAAIQGRTSSHATHIANVERSSHPFEQSSRKASFGFNRDISSFGQACTRSRKEVVDEACKNALESWRAKHILLSGTEFIAVLGGLGLTSGLLPAHRPPRSQRMQRTVGMRQGSSRCTMDVRNHANFDCDRSMQQRAHKMHALPLNGRMNELRHAIAVAWEDVEVSQGCKTYMRPKQRRMMPDVSPEKVHSYLVDRIRLSDASLAFIEKNVGIKRYSKRTMCEFLQTIVVQGVEKFSGTSFLGANDCQLQFGQSSLLYRKILVARDTLRGVAQWEDDNTSQLDVDETLNYLHRTVDDLRFALGEKDEKIASLNRQLNRFTHRAESFENIPPPPPPDNNIDAMPRSAYGHETLCPNLTHISHDERDHLIIPRAPVDSEISREESSPMVPISCRSGLGKGVNRKYVPQDRGRGAKQTLSKVEITFCEAHYPRTKEGSNHSGNRHIKKSRRNARKIGEHTHVRLGTTKKRPNGAGPSKRKVNVRGQRRTQPQASNRRRQNTHVTESKSVAGQEELGKTQGKNRNVLSDINDPCLENVSVPRGTSNDFDTGKIPRFQNRFGSSASSYKHTSSDAKLEKRLKEIDLQARSSEARLNQILERLSMESSNAQPKNDSEVLNDAKGSMHRQRRVTSTMR